MKKGKISKDQSKIILEKVKRIEIKTRKLVSEVFMGQYHSAFKGQGMTFSDFREYVPGDDIRAISWPLTARAGKPYIKQFEEERELTVMLVVDVSGSTMTGTIGKTKKDLIAEITALLGFSAIKNGDSVGMLLFSDKMEHYVAPNKGTSHIMRLIRDLFVIEPKSKNTNIGEALGYLSGALKKRSVVFVISDFLDNGFEKPMRLLSRRHEVVAIDIINKNEQKLPSMGLISFSDPETGDSKLIDTSSVQLGKKWSSYFSHYKQQAVTTFKRSQVGRVAIETESDPVKPLLHFFKSR